MRKAAASHEKEQRHEDESSLSDIEARGDSLRQKKEAGSLESRPPQMWLEMQQVRSIQCYARQNARQSDTNVQGYHLGALYTQTKHPPHQLPEDCRCRCIEARVAATTAVCMRHSQ